MRALWWVVRRRSDVGPGDVPLPFAGRFGLVLGAVTALGLLETAVVHVLLPWETARWVLLVVSVYALFWVLGRQLHTGTPVGPGSLAGPVRLRAHLA